VFLHSGVYPGAAKNNFSQSQLSGRKIFFRRRSYGALSTSCLSKTKRRQRKNKNGERDAVDTEESPTASLEPA
jgi:hypothetical protein